MVMYMFASGLMFLPEGIPGENNASSLRTAPLIQGTLWMVTWAAHGNWSREEFERAVDAQRDVGFDILWILNGPSLMRGAVAGNAGTGNRDLLAMLYEIADERNMRVIIDLTSERGAWHGKATAEELSDELRGLVGDYRSRYGDHRSFYGWYLNQEINPIAPGNREESEYWRRVWKAVVGECHRAMPGSVVTISPFFLLDEARVRGFVYLTPEQYADWWRETLKVTGIDVLMLQDSGEHLAFFTLDDREKFFSAVANACRRVGAKFWLNVETGEVDVANWEEYLALEKAGTVEEHFRFTPIDWLEKKLHLAARYADGIVNWGYYPFMDPMAPGEDETGAARKAYASYKEYAARIGKTAAARQSRAD